MTFGEMIEAMRARLTSRGTSENFGRLVKMGIHSNLGYMNEKEVLEAVDFLKMRFWSASALGDRLNPLEALGVHLLIESAHLYDEIAPKETA